MSESAPEKENNHTELHVASLKFHVGEFCVFTARFPVHTEPFSFARQPLDPDWWPAETGGQKSQGYYLPSAPISPELPVAGRNGTFLRYVPARFDRYFIDLNSTIEDYARKFSSKTRSTLRRKVRKFAALDGDRNDWREYATPEEMGEFYRLARQVSKKTYQERLLAAGLPDTEDFRADMLARAAQDRVRGYLLFLKGEVVSYLYLPCEDDRLIYAYLGYDPEHSKMSPGTVLQWLVVEHLFGQERFRYFDFTEGQGDHKRLFGTDSIHCGNVFFLKSTMRFRVMVRTHRIVTGASDKLVAFLDKIGLKRAIKKWIRARA